MRIDKVYIEDFKNLKKFSIDLDEKQMNTVLLGQNATGKSNFIEALIQIFKHLDLSTSTSRVYPDFSYYIAYQCHGKKIEIDHTKSKTYDIKIEGLKSITYKAFFSKEGKAQYLPKYVFTYYSGVSNRLDELFWKHQENFYNRIIKSGFVGSDLDDLRRLFYVKQIHSFFVLMAFFSLPRMEKRSREFLNNILGIEDLESVLFVLKKANWNNERGDPRFWGADGLVKDFLSVLWDYSLAPIYEEKSVKIDFRRNETQNRLYLYLKDKAQLKAFAKKYFDINQEKPNNTFLFKALESTYISDMLEEVKVVVKKKKDGKVTFKELSEGEQQLLTVIGLLIFTREDESLVLLDEPDTHLNPLWKYDYLHFLKTLVKSKEKLQADEGVEDNEEDETTQIIINTHDPLMIGSMVKSQVRLFGKDGPKASSNEIMDRFDELRAQSKNEAIEPDVDPQGLGVAGILRSELFGLKTVLDRETNLLLEERNRLMYKQSKGETTEKDLERLEELFDILSRKGFNQTFRDPLFEEYIVERMKNLLE
ncbi:AAA family ATPase [Phaeodactylibacter xiamenensis]|uniref:AAA family ATPase n=1 Tax=Phaeodactylibacter xiamenensis TaxID=1524460 RepID=UPI003BABCDB0